jgi:hypothetical protein
MTAGPYRAQSPEHDTISEVGSVSTNPAPSEPEKDPSLPVKGMYPLLDLISEQGSSGLGKSCFFRIARTNAQNILVDKIVIAQGPLQEFINALSPGAYSSITKVNFKTLDGLVLKPLGIYGSKEEIVRFLLEIKAVDDNTYVFALSSLGGLILRDSAQDLLVPNDGQASGSSEPDIRSGLYIVRSFLSASEEQAYVVYWPEETTWDDRATPSVQRNRVTFMRYDHYPHLPPFLND